jgi:hypothetical protein
VITYINDLGLPSKRKEGGKPCAFLLPSPVERTEAFHRSSVSRLSAYDKVEKMKTG